MRPPNGTVRRADMKALSLLLTLCVLSACTTMSSSPPVKTVEHVDLDRYMGRWYVIANVPYFLEKGKVGSSDNYARRADGKLQADFVFRKKTLSAPEQTWKGVATITNPVTNAEWSVSFIWPFRAAYRLVALDDSYRWAVVTNGSGTLIWVLSRTTTLPDGQYREILTRVSALGLASDKLVLVPQAPQ